MTDEPERVDRPTVTYVVPHSPESVGYDSVAEFLELASYHVAYAEAIESTGYAVEMVVLRRGPVGDLDDIPIPVQTLPVTAGRSYGWEFSLPLVYAVTTDENALLHIHGYNQPNLAPLLVAAGLAGQTVVVHNHGAPLDRDRIRNRVWYRLLTTLLLRTVDRVVSVNRDELDVLESYGVDATKFVHIPNVTDTDRFRPRDRESACKELGLDPDERYVLYVGRLIEMKGVQYLVRAIADVDATLLLVYSGTDDEEVRNIRSLVTDLGLESRVRFVGAVPHDRLERYYNAADVCAFPSLQEGFGIVTLEAMACSTPVVGTTAHSGGGHLEHEKNALVVTPGSVDSLVENLNRLLVDEAFRERLGRIGRQTVEAEYTWDVVAERLDAVYRAALR